MLQIISGKFFNGLEKHECIAKGILYSNCTWYGPINTAIGTLESVEGSGDISGFVFTYKNQIEKKGPLVRCGDEEIVEQMKVICAFGLKSYFSEYREQVIRVCSPIKSKNTRGGQPNQFIEKTVELNKHLKTETVSKFQLLVEKIISLERSKYNKVIITLRTILNSIEVVTYNTDLAYSMLIYCIESLSKEFEASNATWVNWEQSSKQKLDAIFQEIDTEKAENIKATLVKGQHFKLQQQFLAFSKHHVNDTFFVEECAEATRSLRKSQLVPALKNAYQMRSKFVHTLKPVQEHIMNPAFGQNDIFTFSDIPYLTYSGLFRLTNHIIESYILSLPSFKSEKFDYQKELPGILTMELAPQYWISKTESFTAENASKRLSGLLTQLETEKTITDLSALMTKVQEIFFQSSPKYRPLLMAFYTLYNSILRKDLRLDNWHLFVSKNQKYLEEKVIENLVVKTIVGGDIWCLDDCIKIYENYQKNRFKKYSLSLSPFREAVLLANLANYAHSECRCQKFNLFIKIAVTELAGKVRMQEYLMDCYKNYSSINIDKLYTLNKPV